MQQAAKSAVTLAVLSVLLVLAALWGVERRDRAAAGQVRPARVRLDGRSPPATRSSRSR